MGLFDSLFGTNTTDATDKATAAANQTITGTQAGNNAILTGAAGQARGDLTGGVNGALSSLLAGNAAGNNAVQVYGTAGQNAINGGANQAAATVQGSNAAFEPYEASGTAANDMLSNSLGLNGASGNAAATGAFQAAPGYQYQVDQATDAASRKAASLGMAASGNTLDAITRLSANLANQGYGNWQSQLSGLSGQGLTAAGAISGNNATAGGYQYGAGTADAGILSQMGQLINNNNVSLGTGQAGLQSGLGSALGTVDTNLGTNEVNNNWTGTNATTKNSLADASAQDAATNANNGIFSKLIGTAVGTGLKALTL